MRAIVFDSWKSFPTLKEVDIPRPRPGEVLLKVAGSGACHSDVAIYSEFDESAGPQLAPPYILGHEITGWAESWGDGVTGIEKGAAYIAYGPIGCGRCRACSRGQDTYCENVSSLSHLAVGLGRDGGMAEYVSLPARNLVPLGSSDPIAAAPLADAGLTPYHAIKNAMDRLRGGGTSALVIGLGGLGQIAVQILAAITGAAVIATDSKPFAMERATSRGALTVPPGDDRVARIREVTGGRGVDAVFDFVGSPETIDLAMKTVAVQGRVTVAGIIGAGDFTWNFFAAPWEVTLANTYWGTIEELHELVALYQAGKIVTDTETFTLDTALTAYRRLEEGSLSGRAVIVPHARD